MNSRNRRGRDLLPPLKKIEGDAASFGETRGRLGYEEANGRPLAAVEKRGKRTKARSSVSRPVEFMGLVLIARKKSGVLDASQMSV